MTDVPTYTSWEAIPDNLKTRTSLKKMSMKPKRGAQPAAKIRTQFRSKVNVYDLYDVADCQAYRVSAAQKAALEKARTASLEKRTCKGCGFVQELGRDYRGKHYVHDGYCESCWEDRRIMGDQQDAHEWAKQIVEALSDGVVEAGEILILDSETTDLYGEIIELGIINMRGEVVYNQRFKPVSEIAPGAQQVHSISADDLEGCPDFADEYLKVRAILENAGKVLIYNAEFDITCLQHTAKLHGCDLLNFNAECLMTWYSQYVGRWSYKYRDYQYIALGGDHTALGDCKRALAVMEYMAREVPNQKTPRCTGVRPGKDNPTRQ